MENENLEIDSGTKKLSYLLAVIVGFVMVLGIISSTFTVDDNTVDSVQPEIQVEESNDKNPF